MAVLSDRGNRVRVNGARALRIALALAVAVLGAAVLLADSALATSRSTKRLGTLNRQVLAAVNRFRAAHGLVALRESAGLDRAARQHSPEMGQRGYFAHSSADGTVFWRRPGTTTPPPDTRTGRWARTSFGPRRAWARHVR